ncbi:dihydropyrimidinase [Paralimibaculum aggregatum]|uniref:Dihydropyrimidinase n=1 Tax=Paralimibaculum aggregatum TaxID=3036245 RepID=A0ABQ6LMB2_9RHOB|nr:dihydropyrimidinase [Limibaculum sp. NKW23]GMG81576.1 dihydropyrimidinase [Limibaculum sp. NKW23]
MSFDTVIRGGTLVTASERFRADIGIRDGRIAALAESLGPADRVIDAAGRLVMPGGIEAHCHIAQESANGMMTADDYRSGSVSAVHGGNSCIVPFAAQRKGMGVAETLDLYDSRAAGRSVIDWSYHLIISDPTEAVLAELPTAFARGVTSFKVFMTYPLMKLDDAQFLEILAVARAHGALTMVHAENDGMIAFMSERLLAGGHTAPRYHAPSHPALAEEEAVHRAISLARLVDAPLMIVHVSTPEGAALVQKARLAGAPVFGETCPQYLFLTREDLDRPGTEGAKYICSPPLRDAATQDALWRHLQAGTFTVFSSDHAPYRHDETGKLKHGPEASFRQIANGMPGIALRLPLLFSEGVNGGRITPEQFVALSSTNAARLYGMLPRKGTLAIGADADIAVWDPALTRRVAAADQHDAMDYTPFEGRALTGWPVTVLSRGVPVLEDGAFCAPEGHGRFVARDRLDLTGLGAPRAPEVDPASNFGAEILR